MHPGPLTLNLLGGLVSMIEIEIYPGIFKEVKTIEETTCKYNPKAIVIGIDEMTEVSEGSDYKAVNSIKDSIASIARLGRASAVHLFLATQRPSSNVISNDIKNNIHQSVILGEFDAAISGLIFDEDISHKAKPEIKGRGFTKVGKEIFEFQSYLTNPEKDFVVKEKPEEQYEKKLQGEEEPMLEIQKESPFAEYAVGISVDSVLTDLEEEAIQIAQKELAAAKSNVNKIKLDDLKPQNRIKINDINFDVELTEKDIAE